LWTDFVDGIENEGTRLSDSQGYFLKHSVLVGVEKEKTKDSSYTSFDFVVKENELTIEHYVDFKEYRWRTPFTTYSEEVMHGGFFSPHPFLTILEKFEKNLENIL